MIVTLWILGAIFIPFVLAADERKIGFWLGFLACLFLSPIIGIIVILVSKDKNEIDYSKEIFIRQKQHEESFSKTQNISISDELNKLKVLKDNGTLTEEEFQKAKDKLL